uniref:lipase 3-like n=1 Tax=Vespula vulgaris TaxID=7454 RepID=UPI0021313005|nr:lipase 3-like [Vespula vulgaris]
MYLYFLYITNRTMKLILLTMLLLFDRYLGRTSSFSLLKYILSSNGNELKKVRSESELNGDDTVLDFIGLVQRHGYPAEEHNVITDDGYILTIHRIPNSPLSDKNEKKRVVFMQHGMTASSDSWVLLEPKKDLPILLADNGYDVWLGNFRGNTYCRSHVNLTTDNPKFWEFSYHDIGLHDTPQYIDYVLNYTGSKKLFYIGHSMGTSVSYVMLSMKPSYNDKMRLVISLAPVSYFKHKFPPILQRIMKDVPKLKRILEKEGIYDILPQSKMIKLLGTKLCNDKSIFQSICASIFYLVSGRDTAQTNASLLPYLMSYVPAGVSTQSLFHYYQNYLTGNFEAYDYGYEGNLIHYEKAKPPIYDVKKIVAPLALFYGINDVLTNEEDATELSKRLPNLVTCEAVPYECFSHFDFVVANDVKTLLYDRLLNLMKEF